MENKKIKLFCIPGGGASAVIYLKWAALLSKDIRQCLLELPGRGLRIREQTLTDIDEITEDLYWNWEKQMNDTRDEEYVLFGYCVGAIFLYELYKKIKENNKKLPLHVIISAGDVPYGEAYAAPFLDNPTTKYQFYDLIRSCFPEHVFKDTDMLKIFREKFVDVLYEKYGRDKVVSPITTEELRLAGCNQEMLESFEFKECLELANELMLLLSNDMDICGRYQNRKGQLIKMECDITVLLGDKDILLPAESMKKWKDYTEKGCNIITLDGDHRVLMGANERAVGEMNKAIERCRQEAI